MKNRLLIANRDVEWRELYQRFLAEFGYEVETSTDGLDCLTKLRHGAPVVLVLDLDLPWGGGDGILAWLREESSAPKVTVLLMGTAAPGPETEKLKESPVVDYLPKPVGLTPLLRSIRSVFTNTERSEPSEMKPVPFYLESFLG